MRSARVLLRVASTIAVVSLASLVPAGGAPAGASSTEPGTAMRGDRYCELLLLQPSEGRLDAQVWSTYGLGDCPDAEWRALDPAAVASAEGVAVVLRNGPRYWLIDRARRSDITDLPVRTLDGIPMRRLGAVSLAPSDIGAGAYRPQRVVRDTTMIWPAGERVYELTGPDGAVYVMQSWSQQVDPTLGEPDLRRLGDRLDLPEGWRYSSRVPDRRIRVGTDAEGAATVLQDDLMNSYSRRR